MRLQELLTAGHRVFFETHIGPMLMLQGFVREIACKLERTDAEPLPILLNGVRREAADGEPCRIEYFIFDATERASYEAVLRDARYEAEQLAAIVQSSPNAIVRVRADGVVDRWNGGAHRMFDIPPEAAIGAPVERLVPLNGSAQWFGEHAGKVDDNEGLRLEAKAANGLDLDITMARIANPESVAGTHDYSLILRDISYKARHERQLETMVRELNHRVKNTLAVVLSIARQTLRPLTDKDGFEEFAKRVMAMAKSHSLLTKGNWEGADIGDLVAEMGEEAAEGRIRTQGPKLHLSAEQVTGMSMALHELLTNAVKYGALSNGAGSVVITWQIVAGDPEKVEFRWQEHGGPHVEVPDKKGFGTMLVEKILASQFNGAAKLDFEPGGVRYRLTFPRDFETADSPSEGRAP